MMGDEEFEERTYMEQREQLHEAVQEALRHDPAWSDTVVTGWALVVTTAGAAGGRGILVRSSNANGDTDLTGWEAEGVLTYALRNGMFEAEMWDPSTADSDDDDGSDDLE
jgi:hypothetical protein